MTSHTKGPWNIFTNDVPGLPHYWTIMAADGRFIASFPKLVVEAREQQRGDALVIAAAPDLLEALRVMVERYTSLVNCGDCGNWDPESEEQVIAARAAIAKTTPIHTNQTVGW